MALPVQAITTKEYARTKRMMVNQGGEPFKYDPAKTPYSDGIMDALDHPMVRLVLVKGNTRSGKTVAAENFALKRWTYGPATNVLWFAQDEDSLNDYIDERGEEMLRIHPEVNEKTNWGDKKSGRKRRDIGRSKIFYRPATMRALRMKAAPLIVGDEIDAWTPKARDAAPTLLTSRQEEFGSAAKAFLASHADAGPDGGIDKHLKDSLLHLWWVNCPHCHNSMSPAQEAEETGKRLAWNVPSLMGMAEGMERLEFLEMVAREVRLICPHDQCKAEFDADQRKDLMSGGMWLQPHQRLMPDGTVEGTARMSTIMGFVIHAFMAPFVKLGETARDWAAGTLAFDDTGNDVQLREAIVKKLGETYFGAKEDEIVEGFKTIQARLSSRYELKTVPAGVKFLTAFVDVQGDRFEVRVIGWDLGKQSWLIDAYAIKQWPRFGEHGAFDNIDPGGKLSDWDIIEEAVLTKSYPLASNPERLARGEQSLFMPIARTMVDGVGVPGVTANARAWLSNLMARKPGGTKRVIPGYRVQLVHGASSKKAPLYGKPMPVEVDDVGKQRTIKIFERYPNVHEIKRMISRRMKVETPGPGRMHLPATISKRYARELVSERLTNGDWRKMHRDNETWDAWVMCEVARETLKPDRPELWDQGVLPEWADPRPKGQGIDNEPVDAVNPFDRLAAINAGISGELER
jgi:phage terminase large subunit GpA-like protein